MDGYNFQPFDYARAVGSGQQNALRAMQIKQAGQQMQRQNAINQLMQSENPVQALQQAGFQQEAMQLGGQSADFMLKGMEFVSKSAPTVSSQGTYDKFRSDMESMGFAKPGVLPDEYNDQTKKILAQMSSGAKQQYETFMQNKALMQRPVGGGKTEVLLKPSEIGGGRPRPLSEKEIIDLQKEREKEQQRMQASARKAEYVASKVDEAVGQVFETPDWTTGTRGQIASLIPGAPAYNLEETIKTIKANIGFDELQKMREMSPTGGALGQVAVQELENLQATLGSLKIGQDSKQLMQNLGNVKLHYTNWKRATEGQEPLTQDSIINQAREALKRGADRKTVEKRLATFGIFME